MKLSDKRAFADMLAGLLDIYGRTLTPASAGLWWAAFERHSLEDVGVAFSRYTQDSTQGRYPPTPAAVLGCLPTSMADTRLCADEAWALALEALDETASVCLTNEMLDAVVVAKTVWETGDKIGARMAFKGAYERITSERRMQGRAPTWQLSLGDDAEGRVRAAQEALRLGRLPLERVKAYLPPPPITPEGAAIAGLITGNVVALPNAGDKIRRKLAEIRAAIEPEKDRSELMAEEREKFEERKRKMVRQVEDLKKRMGGDGAA